MAKMAENQLKKDMKTQRLKMIGCLEAIARWNCAYPNPLILVEMPFLKL